MYALGHFHEADPTTTQDQRQAKPSGLVDYLGRYRAEALAEPDQQPGDPGAGEPAHAGPRRATDSSYRVAAASPSVNALPASVSGSHMDNLRQVRQQTSFIKAANVSTVPPESRGGRQR